MRRYTGGEVPRWEMYELRLSAAELPADPFEPGLMTARFVNEACGIDKTVEGFYAGDCEYAVRFMPEAEGEWRCTARLCGAETQRAFTCTAPLPGEHGPVRPIGTDFYYADGARCCVYGTTCYAWAHQPDDMRACTLETLKRAPFNKMRMCVFPKYYKFNLDDPKLAPFLPGKDGGFDELQPNPAYFDWFEESVSALRDLGIIADIILFHPYDRWGYAHLSIDADRRYLRYAIARLAACSNVWWAMANEYDLMAKSLADWRSLGELVREYDPYDHPRSIHNCRDYYDHSEDWITHCSLQRQDVYKHVEYTDELIARWHKPVVWDEIAYEGNVFDGWGSITGEELTRRFWETYIRGGYPGHGETILPADGGDDRTRLWWSHGGELRGESPARIAFLRKIHESEPQGCEFWHTSWDLICRRCGDEQYLFYHSFMRPVYRYYPVRPGRRYRVEVIDTWDMTITDMGITPVVVDEPIELVRQPEGYASLRVALPGKPFIACRITAVD